MSDLFIVAGEKSGDLHGEKLIEALLHQNPSLQMSGIGGPLMRKYPFDCLFPMEDLQVMGFVDVFLALPKLYSLFYKTANAILATKPKIVITIDYPGFNLRLHRYLKKKGFEGKLVHFICPSVWAWGKKRIPLMAKTLDLLLCILPFEPELFKNTPLKSVFVGHPLCSRISSYTYKPLSFPKGKKIISLFPGSRQKEIQKNLPLLLEACKKLEQEHSSLHFALSVSEERFFPLIQNIVAQRGISNLSFVPSSSAYDLMKMSDLALAKSGTVTLELAIHTVPTVVFYAVSKLDRWIAYDLLRIRLPFYCLVNIIAGKQVFPELIGPNFTEKRLLAEAKLLMQPEKKEEIQKECALLQKNLSAKNASSEAAAHILSLI